MSAPLPPELDDRITRFQAAIDQFLDREDFRLDPTHMPRINSPADFIRVAIRPPRHAHQTWAAAVPEARERLVEMISLGYEVIGLAPDSPGIVGPVNDVIRLSSEEQSEISSLTTQAAKTPFILLLPSLLAFGKRQDTRRKDIAAARDSLTAYYLMQMPPRDSEAG